MVEIMRNRDPLLVEELGRDFRPLRIMEGNFTYRVCGPDMRIRIVHRRQRKIQFVSLDQNRACEVVDDLGVATSDDPFVMPCDEEVEMAQALELFEWAKRKASERKAREAWVKPLRTAAFIQAVAESNDEAVKQAVGASTFGQYLTKQRESA